MTNDRPVVGVLGAGSWGTALAVHLARAGHPVRLWARSPALCAELRGGENPRYLRGVRLPAALDPTSELGDLAACEPIVVAVPSHGFRSVVRQLLEACPQRGHLTLVSATKGIEEESLARMTEVCFEEGVRARRELKAAVLSGPSFATELAAGMPTAVVLACHEMEVAHRLQHDLSARNLRLYRSTDVAGVELGGACKNVVAIAAGVLAGLGFGHNTLAALITRGLHEMARLGQACGGRAPTFSGLAGMGDLVLTCTGGPSRNRRTGVLLAEGRALSEIQAELGTVAEGVKNSMSIATLARRVGVEMPIIEQMVEVLYRDKPPRSAVEELMSRGLKSESEP